MRIGFYGGSFNPPHFSHFLAATWALCTGEVDQVWMVPCFQHAFGKDLAPFAHRLRMCELGAASLEPHVRVSDCERTLESTFTIDVIQALRSQHPTHEFRLMIGSDIAGETHKWNSFAALEALAPPLWIPRGGYDANNPLGFHLPAISSSTIRERLREGQSVEGAVPPAILRYLSTHQLYLPSP